MPHPTSPFMQSLWLSVHTTLSMHLALRKPRLKQLTKHMHCGLIQSGCSAELDAAQTEGGERWQRSGELSNLTTLYANDCRISSSVSGIILSLRGGKETTRFLEKLRSKTSTSLASQNT